MNYAKWITYFEPNATEGFTPESEIKEGIEGAICLPDFAYIGYIADNLDLTGLEKYKITLLSANEALVLAQTVNSEIHFDSNGKFASPPHLIEN